MVEEFQYYTIFSPEGKLIQIENALVALNKSQPILIIKNTETIIAVSKKPKIDILEDVAENGDPHVFKANGKVYGIITGFEADTEILKSRIADLSSNKEYNLDAVPSAEILSKAFSEKAQKFIQKSGQRPLCFGVVFFENYDSPNLFYVDTSAVCLPYLGVSVGESSSKVNKFLEKNLKINLDTAQLEEVALEAIGESIGQDFGPSDVIVSRLNKNGFIEYLTTEQVDAILLRISEKN